MVWNLPNALTWARIAAIPLIVVLFYMPYPWADPAAGLLFVAAGITDSLDGYFARRFGQISRLGASRGHRVVPARGVARAARPVLGDRAVGSGLVNASQVVAFKEESSEGYGGE